MPCLYAPLGVSTLWRLCACSVGATSTSKALIRPGAHAVSGVRTWACLHCGASRAARPPGARLVLLQHGRARNRPLLSTPLRAQGLLQPLDQVLLNILFGGKQATLTLCHLMRPVLSRPRAASSSRSSLTCNRACRRLQPYLKGAATVCAGGCNRMRRRLQPYALEAATVCARPAHATSVV